MGRALGKTLSLSPAASFVGEGAEGQVIFGSCPSCRIMGYVMPETSFPALGQGRGRWGGGECMMGTVSVWEDETVLQLEGGDGCTVM